MAPASTRPEPRLVVADGLIAGERIDRAIAAAQDVAYRLSRGADLATINPTPFDTLTQTDEPCDDGIATVAFDFNGIEVRTFPGSDMFGLLRDYRRALAGLHEGPAGPSPVDLTGDQLREEADRADRLAAERAERDAAAAAQATATNASIEVEIGDIELDLADPDAWQQWVENNTDPCGGACVTYARRWGKLMQARMADGAPLADVATQASHDADTDDRGCVVTTTPETPRPAMVSGVNVYHVTASNVGVTSTDRHAWIDLGGPLGPVAVHAGEGDVMDQLAQLAEIGLAIADAANRRLAEIEQAEAREVA